MDASYFRHHVFVCTNRRPPEHPRRCCGDRNPEAVLMALKSRVNELGLQGVRINTAGCMDRCEQAVVVYPDAVWYSLNSPEDAREVVENHLQNGQVVERLRMAG